MLYGAPEASPSPRNCEVLPPDDPGIKDMETNGDEESVASIEGSWLRSRTSHTCVGVEESGGDPAFMNPPNPG